MATVADYLSTGPEALESDLVKNVFPGETPDAPKRDILDFQREEAPDVEIDPRQVQDDFFKKALNEEVDVNTMFDGPNKINYNIIKEAIDANKALNLANSANQILPNKQ
jgi:hypothetical protein